jgi:ABC-2 type transport system permease protein
VVSLDDSVISRNITQGLKADTSLHTQELSLSQAKALVLKGNLNAAIIIPAGFGDASGAAFFGGNKPEIEILYDPSQSAVFGMVKGLLTQQVMQSVNGEIFSGKSGQKLVDQRISQLEKSANPDLNHSDLLACFQSLKKVQRSSQDQKGDGKSTAAAGGLTTPFVTRDQAMSSGPKYNGYAHSFAGMSIQFILFMGLDAGISILLARRQGLWSRLLAAPVSLRTILGARAISSGIIALGMLAFVYLVGSLFFKVQIAGSVVGFVLLCLCFALFTSMFGLFIAAFGKTPEAARSLATFATLIMVMLGGAWVPAFIFPQWLQTLTLAVPVRWAVDGFDAMTWRGLPLEAALPPVAVLLGFSIAFGALALWKFRRIESA